MAQAIPTPYNLSNAGSRRVGLTRSSNFQGPHAHRFPVKNIRRKDVKKVKQEDVDIDAPPQDSSEEERVPIFEAENYGEASDTTDSDSQRKPPSSQQDPTLPSTTPPSGRQSVACSPRRKYPQKNGSQVCGQKRKAEQVSDDETIRNMSFRIEKQKRTAGYGKSRAGPQHKTMSEPVQGKEPRESIAKRNSQGAEEGVSAFICPRTDGLLAEREPSSPVIFDGI